MNDVPMVGGREEGSFDWGMHYFRAFAIFCIVAVHAFAILGYDCVFSLLRSSTIYFLFISGYLCQYLALKKGAIVPSVYYKKKFYNVVCPYLVWTFIHLGVAMLLPADRPGIMGVLPSYPGFDGLILRVSTIIDIIFDGQAACQLWYIPFVLPLFAVSPFFAGLSSRGLLVLTGVAAFMFLLFPDRVIAYPGGTSFIEKVSLYFHFTVFYLLGFVYARYKHSLDMVFSRYVWLFLLMSMLLVMPYFLNSIFGLTLMNVWQAYALQKLFFIPVAICCVYKFANRHLPVLDNIAKLSFAIYFIHMLCLSPFVEFHKKFISGSSMPLVLQIVLTVLIFALYFIVTCVCAKLLKLILRSSSRYLIGA